MKATSIAFERRYVDDSGVEFAVRLVNREIELEAVNKINFPEEEIDWLINCLYRVKDEINKP